MVEDLQIILGVVAFVIALYLALRLLQKKPLNKKYQRELEEILTKEQYKVKGRHD